jgi:RNA methyltransferase, TrmH family
MPEFITSPANLRVKSIRKLRERKERQQTGLFFIEGLRIVTEAVQMGAGIEYLVTSPELLVSSFGRELMAAEAVKELTRVEVSPEVFELISLKDGPQGIGAVVRQSWQTLDEINLADGALWVALDSVADPGNLGTILRTCDAVGANGIILLDNATDPYDPTAIRASMGAVFSQKLAKASTEQFITWVKQNKYALIGASDAAQNDYHLFTFPDPCILLMGSERQGMQKGQQEACDHLVSIPMVGRSDSLNLAVATAVILYEIFNQRRERTL